MSDPVPPNPQPAELLPAALMDLLHAFVLPLFAAFLGPEAADWAAKNAIRSCQPRSFHEAMLAARTIAFGLAVQDNLRLAMAADLTVAAKLRLRANANALDRSVARNHAALEQCQAIRVAAPDQAELADMLRDAKGMITQANADIAAAKAVVKSSPGPATAPVAPAKPAASASPAEPAQAAPAKPTASAAAAAAPAHSVQPPRTPDPRSQLHWADAMTFVADEMTAAAAALPPAQQKRELMRARLLGSAARNVSALARDAAATRLTVMGSKQQTR